jgi:hypothetical protein
MGGSGKNEKETWSGTRLTLTPLASLVYGQLPGNADRPAGSADQCQVRIRSGAIPAWG